LTALVLGWTWRKTRTEPGLKPLVSHALATSPAPCAIALTAHSGSLTIDEKISRLQQETRISGDPASKLEQLGWLFIKKARLSYDPGYYKLAEECAACIDSQKNGSPEALLLRAHALQSLHQFSAAEPLARKLVSLRGLAFDYGVLGDVLVDEGKTQEAVDAYQKMVDLRPDLQSYTRAAHVRWLKGNLHGAIELMKLAASSGSPADPESAAWAFSRLSLYQLQAGDTKSALRACDAALNFQSDYAPALLARGRILLAQHKTGEAINALSRAATLNPLPEYLWNLADALRANGNVDAARLAENEILQRGAANDPRTLALFLATRGEQSETAVRLSEQELRVRLDAFTHDAFAWSLAAAGQTKEARDQMNKALAEGTKDARLFFHAGVISWMSGQKQEARRWLNQAYSFRQMLLPSEKEQLSKYVAKS